MSFTPLIHRQDGYLGPRGIKFLLQIIRDTASRMAALEGLSFQQARYLARQTAHAVLGNASCLADYRIYRACAPFGSASVLARPDTCRVA
eukprot:1463799-Amphidinium_carterae.1